MGMNHDRLVDQEIKANQIRLKFNRSSHKYDSLQEAIAYLDGIRFANDSALEEVGIRETREGRYEVLMWDGDAVHDYKTQSVKESDLMRFD